MKHVKVYLLNLESAELENIHDILNTYRPEKSLSVISLKLLKYILVNKVNIDAEMINIKRTVFGKPYLEGMSNIHFNYSHSSEMIVCAVHDCNIGIDIEKVEDIDNDVKYEFMTKVELNSLALLHDNQQLNAIYRYWVLKESFLKAIGFGLKLCPKSVEVSEDMRIVYNDITWYCKSLLRNRRYYMSICTNSNFTFEIEEIKLQDLINNTTLNL